VFDQPVPVVDYVRLAMPPADVLRFPVGMAE